MLVKRENSMLVLEPREAAGETPCFIMQDYRKFIQRGRGREQIFEVHLDPVTPRGRPRRLPECSVSGLSISLMSMFKEV